MKIAFMIEVGLKMGMSHIAMSITLSEEVKDSFVKNGAS